MSDAGGNQRSIVIDRSRNAGISNPKNGKPKDRADKDCSQKDFGIVIHESILSQLRDWAMSALDQVQPAPCYHSPESDSLMETITMPLFRTAGDLMPDLEGVRFPMRDEAAQKSVSCLVTFEFLQDRSGVFSSDAGEMLGEFEIYRAEIEELASRKYDRGEDPPRITKADSALNQT